MSKPNIKIDINMIKIIHENNEINKREQFYSGNNVPKLSKNRYNSMYKKK